MTEPLKRQSIVPRMDGIMRDIEKLKKLSAVPFDRWNNIDKELIKIK